MNEDYSINLLILYHRHHEDGCVKTLARELASIQPMPNVDLEAIGKHPLWQSFCRRHFT